MLKQFITNTDVQNMLYDCVGRIKVLADKNEIETLFDFPDTTVEINTDEEKLQRAIDNITFNCLRHTKTSICVGYRIEDERLTIKISDDGEGISETDLPHIFERFYKGANGNSGLGLSISKDIAEKLGGDIKVENSKKGAVFIINIPMCYSK